MEARRKRRFAAFPVFCAIFLITSGTVPAEIPCITQFQAGHGITVDSVPIAGAAGDFDKDSLLDFLSFHSGNSTVIHQKGLGNGLFEEGPATNVDVLTRRGATADFDSDGNPDAVLLDSNMPGIQVILGNGDGTFSALAPQDLSLWGQAPTLIEAGNLNPGVDMFPDLFIAMNIGAPGPLLVLFGAGSYTFTILLEGDDFPDVLAIDGPGMPSNPRRHCLFWG